MVCDAEAWIWWCEALISCCAERFTQSIALYCNVCKRVYLNVDAVCFFYLSIVLSIFVILHFFSPRLCLLLFFSPNCNQFGCILSTEDLPGTALFNKITIPKICTQHRSMVRWFLIVKIDCVHSMSFGIDTARKWSRARWGDRERAAKDIKSVMWTKTKYQLCVLLDDINDIL